MAFLLGLLLAVFGEMEYGNFERSSLCERSTVYEFR